MATAKKTENKKPKKADAAEVDELLGDGKKATKKPAKKTAKEDDVLEGKAAAKKPAKGKKASKAAGVASDDVRAAILKCRKLTSYADVAEATGADLRQVRRLSRSMRDAGEIEIVKEGTVCFVKKK